MGTGYYYYRMGRRIMRWGVQRRSSSSWGTR